VEGCKLWRLPHYLDNRLTDGGVVNLTHLLSRLKIPSTPLC
jgi:hypothetical protein